jgi:hypothetical protein
MSLVEVRRSRKYRHCVFSHAPSDEELFGPNPEYCHIVIFPGEYYGRIKGELGFDVACLDCVFDHFVHEELGHFR